MGFYVQRLWAYVLLQQLLRNHKAISLITMGCANPTNQTLTDQDSHSDNSKAQSSTNRIRRYDAVNFESTTDGVTVSMVSEPLDIYSSTLTSRDQGN